MKRNSLLITLICCFIFFFCQRKGYYKIDSELGATLKQVFEDVTNIPSVKKEGVVYKYSTAVGDTTYKLEIIDFEPKGFSEEDSFSGIIYSGTNEFIILFYQKIKKNRIYDNWKELRKPEKTIKFYEVIKQKINEEKPKPDLILNLRELSILEQVTLVVNGKSYLFVKTRGVYKLFKVDQSTELTVKLEDLNHDKKITMNLGDGKIYLLAYNPDIDEYQLSLR